MSNNALHIIITGGTIDSYYDGTKDTVVPASHSIIPRCVASLKLSDPVEYTEVCMKDSRSLTPDDLRMLAKTVVESPATRVIITHGTYTMPDSARYIQAHLQRNDQVIILTGSMIPLDGFTLSDAGFNLGFAVAQTAVLKPGVYVCMNGQVFSPDEVAKLLQEGRFASIYNL